MEQTDDELLQKFQKIIKITSRIKKSELADALDLSDKDLILKLGEWGEKFSIKINDDTIIVDDIEKFTAALDQQFAAWGDMEKNKDGKLSVDSQR